MRPPRISTFPLDKPFERQDPRTALSEVALRLVVNFYTDAPYVVGTATMLGAHLLITAKHVLEGLWTISAQSGETAHVEDFVAIQVLPGPDYLVWDIVEAIVAQPTDLALLRLATTPGRGKPGPLPGWKQLRVNPFPPAVGETIAAFGYKDSTIRISKNATGGNHIELNDDPMMSVGVVREIFEWRRDALLPFPCYQVGARFDHGMSGGAVFDETGCLCGLVCSNVEGSHLDGEPISYVTSLWPIFAMIIGADRGNKYPRGVRYPVIELARGGQIAVPDLERLNAWFALHIKS